MVVVYFITRFFTLVVYIFATKIIENKRAKSLIQVHLNLGLNFEAERKGKSRAYMLEQQKFYTYSGKANLSNMHLIDLIS